MRTSLTPEIDSDSLGKILKETEKNYANKTFGFVWILRNFNRALLLTDSIHYANKTDGIHYLPPVWPLVRHLQDESLLTNQKKLCFIHSNFTFLRVCAMGRFRF